ncbi:uncharacterized protein LOC141912260 [Tubulanus polymorphus]|uniref:uncharacterized protein LOC141912260 n=1 Tax=Tubulanus polymorphus TaxID=672921 RepID=UPI003DA5BCBB
MLELLDIESSSITPYALKSLVAREKIYIRPIQREILSQTTPKAESVKEKCLKCDQEFPLSLLREHTESCDGLIDDLPKISNAAAAAVAAVKRSISSTNDAERNPKQVRPNSAYNFHRHQEFIDLTTDLDMMFPDDDSDADLNQAIANSLAEVVEPQLKEERYGIII